MYQQVTVLLNLLYIYRLSSIRELEKLEICGKLIIKVQDMKPVKRYLYVFSLRTIVTLLEHQLVGGCQQKFDCTWKIE